MARNKVPSHLSIRQRQIATLKQLVNLNDPVADSKAVEPRWKILIFDQYGQDIISPLLTVKDLRDLGVTLHLSIESARESLPDVPAVYFCSPNQRNIQIITQDFTAGLYESYYFNFIGSLTRPQLEDVASAAVSHACIQNVNKVFDQFVNFISLEDDLFTLRRHNDECPVSYYAVNRPEMTEESMNTIINECVDGLFAVCVTLGVVPIIRCPKGAAAEQVAEKLDRKIRDNLRDARNNLFTSEGIRAGQVNFQRPVLLIMDRHFDLATMLHHTWTYQALVHDTLELELNRVTIREDADEDGRPGKVKEYDLNVADAFWVGNKGRPFPEVAEAVQADLEKYRRNEDEIKRLKSAMGLTNESDEAIGMLGDATAQLTSTVSSLPELLEKKRHIDMHMNVATAVLEMIKSRKLDIYFETEEKLLNRQQSERKVADIVGDAECGSGEDKLRLVLLSYMLDTTGSKAIEQSMHELVKLLGGDQHAFAYVKRWKTFAKLLSDDQYTGGGTKAVDMFSRLLNNSSQLLMDGVKNLTIKRHNLPLTKVVDAVMEQKQMAEVDDYRYFDPKLLRSNDSSTVRIRQPFNDCITFVIGGGNYVEYQNLVDYAHAGGPSKRIIYGCTDIANAQQFVRQLSKLGEEM